MTSSLQPAGDGLSATATCTTTAIDPVSGQTSLTGQFGYYKGLSTLCRVIDSDGYEVSSSDLVAACANPSDPSPTFGDNLLGNPTSTCTWNFPIKPGKSYHLVSRHFLWLNPAASSPYPCIARDSSGYQTLSDPLAWFDNVNGYPPTGDTPVPVYPDTTAPGLSFTDTEEANTSATGSGDEGCYGIETTVPTANGFSGAWEIADTQAELAAIALTNPDAPSATGAEFFQTQFATFDANLSDLQNIPELSGTNLNWCLSPTPGLACFSAPASDAGTLGSAGGPVEVLDTASSSETFFAAAAIPSGTVASPELEYLCVQPTLQPTNYACTQLSLAELQLSACPGGEAGLCGSLGSSPANLGPNQKQLFKATIDASAQLPPASNLASSLLSDVTWGSWSLSGPASTCSTAPVLSLVGAPPSSSTDTYSYCTPADYTGPASLAITASVTLPSSNAGAIPLSDTADFTIQADILKQTITFPPVLRQKAATTVLLSATASSALPVLYISTTPAVCTISGSSVVLVTSGVCNVLAQQVGNSTYGAASASQTILVDPAIQHITFPAVGTRAVNTNLTLTATSSANLPITYTSRTPATCSVSGAVATLSATGSCTIRATQAGNATYAAAGLNQTFQVRKPAVSVAIVSAANPILAEKTLTLSATVFASGASPTGLVDFYSGTTLLGEQTLFEGHASLSTSSLPGGINLITVRYLGDANYPAVTSPVYLQTITKITPVVTITSSPNPAAPNAPFVLTATVVDPSSYGVPTGNVTVYIDGLKAGVISLTDGVATYNGGGFPKGSHRIIAAYAGDQNYKGTYSAILSQAVTR